MEGDGNGGRGCAGTVYVFGVSAPVPWRPSESCASTKARRSACISAETASSCRCSPSMSSVILFTLQVSESTVALCWLESTNAGRA